MDTFLSTTVAATVTELAKTVVTETVKKAASLWGTSDVAYDKELENSLKAYLNHSYNTNSMIKTLIYKNVSKPLKNFYEPLKIRFENTTYDTLSVENLITYLGDHIVITGTGGMGKSTLMRYLYLSCIEEKYALPILIELRDFDKKFKANPQLSLLDYLYEYVRLYKFSAGKDVFTHALCSGKILLLLDGFDELDFQTASYLESEIKEFSIQYNECKVIVSSRPSNEFRNWHTFIEVDMCKLSKEQSISLIQKLELDDSNLKELFISVLESEIYDKYTEFASIPLLLTIMLITYKENASIPKNLHDFYDKAFNTLFYQHDAQKGVYQRELRSQLNREEFKDVLVFFSFNSYVKNNFNYTEEEVLAYIATALKNVNQEKVDPISYLKDLEKNVCILIKDGNFYKFIHRSFQEYFAALFLLKQNDDIQCEVFNKLIDVKNFLLDTNNAFLSTFKFSQPSRYNKNVIYNLSKPYVNYSLQEMFLNIYSGIGIEYLDDVQEIDNLPSLVFTINVTNLYFVFQEYKQFILKRKSDPALIIQARNQLLEKGYLQMESTDDAYHHIEFEDYSDDDLKPIIDILEIYLNLQGLRDWISQFSNQSSTDLDSLLGLL